MPENLQQDVANTIQAIELGIENKDLNAALLRDEVYGLNSMERSQVPDPAYEAKFINELEKQLEGKGLMPKLMLEYARERFPVLEHRRAGSIFGDASDPNNYYIMRDCIRAHMGATSGIRRMIYKNMSEHFGEINNFSPPSRWLLTDKITPYDIQQWAESQAKKRGTK
ncbi:MAG: hypothetical protein K2Z81_15230 [Cyanobacteria bacterium]|nr:hypothetical protein [Cyanobacteriota bacterium]